MLHLKRIPFQDWCWQQGAFTDDDGHFPLSIAAKLLGVSIEQMVGWLNSGSIDSLAPIDIEAAYKNPPRKGIKVPRINPWTGSVEK